MPSFKQSVLEHLDHARQLGLFPVYKSAAKKYDIPVQVLLAKDSRESWLGSYPDLASNDWYGSDGKSRGISQINTDVYPQAVMVDGDAHKWFIMRGAQLLRKELDNFDGNMKAALAAYNTGTEDVRSALQQGKKPNSVTTDGNYVSDVLRRADIIKKDLSMINKVLPIVGSMQAGFQGNVKEAALQSIPGLLILSAGAYFVKDLIDQKTE